MPDTYTLGDVFDCFALLKELPITDHQFLFLVHQLSGDLMAIKCESGTAIEQRLSPVELDL